MKQLWSEVINPYKHINHHAQMQYSFSTVFYSHLKYEFLLLNLPYDIHRFFFLST